MLDESTIRFNCENVAEATTGQGGQLAWAAMINKVDRHDPSFRD